MASFVPESVFELTTGREMVDAARAAVLLAEVDSALDPRTVRLSNKSFSSDAAIILAERIKTYQVCCSTTPVLLALY